MNPSEITDLAAEIKQEIAKIIVGQEKAIELLLTSMLAGGHVLLEGPPGTAKTLLAKSFARCLTLDFSRIQFTPDLMPGDVIGSNIFDFQSSTFKLTKGPIFTELLLGDEINRTPPKTQAALLEAMQERAVTIDGSTHKLSDHFMVVATQNPIEQQGTYPLPEAQLDRFLFKHVLDYPTKAEEVAIVAKQGTRLSASGNELSNLKSIAGADEIERAGAAISEYRISDEIIEYIVNLVRATRSTALISTGASPRAAAMLAAASRAHAAIDGRDYVVPDDIKSLAPPALRHRVVLSPTAEIEGRNVDEILSNLIDQIEAPR